MENGISKHRGFTVVEDKEEAEELEDEDETKQLIMTRRRRIPEYEA